MRKKLLSLILCLAMAFSVNTSVFAANVQNTNEETTQTEDINNVGEMPTGLEPLEVIELTKEEYAAIAGSQEEQENVYAANHYDWEKYASQYCYDHMSAAQKHLYNGLRNVCENVATTTEDLSVKKTINYSDGTTEVVAAMGNASYEGLSPEEAYYMTIIFMFQNPQYYFLHNSLSWNVDENEVILFSYDQFAEGEQRQIESQNFMKKIEDLEKEIPQDASEYNRAKKIHDLVCQKVKYVAGPYDQTAYSAVMQDETVCAGYAKMYSILCNGADLEVCGVTSTCHAWNKVKIDGNWYNVDTTWDDTKNIRYTYFLVSDNTVVSKDSTKYKEHEEQCKKYNVHPVSLVNYTDAKTPLTGVSLSESTVNMKRGDQKTLSVVYEPTNTTARPGIIWTSSNPNAVSVDNQGVITALMPGGSAVITAQVGDFSATCKVTVETEYYSVTFDANGHGNAPASQSIPYGGNVAVPGSMSADGYTLDGWYKEASCEHVWDFANDVVTENVTLYAKWTKVPDSNANPGENDNSKPSGNNNGNNSESSNGSNSGNNSGSNNGNDNKPNSTGGNITETEKPQGTKVATYEGNAFYQDGSGKMRCYDENGKPVINNFKCDGNYTYYFQNDGTAMTDRLTYHPDGKNVIYFDENGHEVFNNFIHVKKSISGDGVDDLCFFDVYGHMYVDFITYDQAGINLYYANPYGVMEHSGWFQFSDGNTGYANADGTLVTNQFSVDPWGRKVYFQGDGKLARGLISDGTTYYRMDETDGHCIEEFPVQ